ncbi:S9 family peptidase [Myxococcus landrumensis]|uniref:DPP IV N-terminal domain-containing protein n=1 Tax=Myxococcus landrumensis TaxID=2813577 RepID=A0ABX7NIH2_9BACT|nr:DPP IV N-terminal domain-containing protein [Myxococcus landrumus]QSQ18438.1 DPP IV N-terminal domain-containing protein [Myxococcus landrumus]
MKKLLTALVLLSTPVLAQPKPTPTSAAPAAPADTFFRQLFETRFFNSGRPSSVTISPDEKTVFFLRNSPTSKALSLFAFDVATQETRELLTPAALLKGADEKLSPEEQARRERMRVTSRGFSSFALSEDGAHLLVGLSGKLYLVARGSGKVTELKTGPGVIDPRFSPTGTQVGYVREHDVYRLDLATNTERRVTQGGTPEKTHGLAEFIAQEEMGRYTGYWWSPDARTLAYTESDTSGVEKLAIANTLNPEASAQQLSYPRAGTANAKVRLGLISANGGKTTWVSWDAAKYPYLATVKWPAKGPLTVLVQNRTQTEEVLLSVDVKTGRTTPLIVETDEAWLNLDQTFPHWLSDGSGFLWRTERNGAAELELRDATGKLVRSVVSPMDGFSSLAAYVEGEETVYFNGGTATPENYLWRARKGEAPTRLTTGGPAMEWGRVSKNGALLVITSEGPSSMRSTSVLKADGTRLGELPSLAQEPPFKPRLEVRQVGTGKDRYATSLVRPRDAKPGVKLPVIVEVYGGPETQMVRQSMAQSLVSQWMADQGFIVVRLDARGASPLAAPKLRKPKYDFARVLLDEQVVALRELAKVVPELDLDRVGITGGSHGGYMSALAVLTRPEVFKAAVAVSAVTDWRDYDTHLTERFLGLPSENPQAYEQSSLLTHVKAGKPMGKLMVIHGTADDNVFFFHALKLSNALFRAGQPHEFLPLNGISHMVMADPLVAERMYEETLRYFKQHL